MFILYVIRYLCGSAEWLIHGTSLSFSFFYFFRIIKSTSNDSFQHLHKHVDEW